MQLRPITGTNRPGAQFSASFAAPDDSCFDSIMHEALAEIGLAGKAVAQICCNNGRETISLRNLGAAEAVGFDRSAAFLEQARELNTLARQDCTFVEADDLGAGPKIPEDAGVRHGVDGSGVRACGNPIQP